MLSTFQAIKRISEGVEGHHTLTPSDVKAVQRVLLEMMDDIHEVCLRENLTYVVSGGCALGSIRHGGFIPWDDDIDICMPRKDYDRFAKLFVSHFPEKYLVQSIQTNPGYDLNFMKVRLKNTVFLELTDTEPELAGLFIDVFPVENVFDNPILRKLQYIMSDGLQFVCSCRRIRAKEKMLMEAAGDNQELVKVFRVKALIGKVFSFHSLRRWLLITEFFLKACRDRKSKMISIPTGRKHFMGEMYPREWFFEPVLRSFEDRSYYFPAHTEYYLEKLYGDYLRIPDDCDKESHTVIKFNLGKFSKED